MRGNGRLRRGLALGFSSIVVASALTAIVGSGGSDAGAAVPVLDHFECYAATAAASAIAPTPFASTPAKVLLKNKFVSGGFIAGPGAVQTHCNPAQTTTVSGKKSVTTPIRNPDAHLVCRAVNPTSLKLPDSVTLKNQFGTGGLKPTAVQSICLSSWTSTAVPVKFPTAPTPPNLDMFVCYAAAHAQGTPAFTPPPVVKLKDQFGAVSTKLGAANILCLPSSQTVNPYGGPSKIVNPDTYSVCFTIPAKAVARTVYDKNQFGIGAVTTTRSTELCVPSSKVAAPPPTTTTTIPVPAGIVTSYSYPSIQGPYDIAAGTDGALWFSNYFGNSIGRITTDGTVTNFPDPSISRPDGVEAGADGGMYFANTGNSTIGRVTADGTVSNFADPRISSPYRVAAGPGLVTWFTSSTANSIGWVSPSGQVNAFYNAGIQNPQGITAGPDGNMWFANFYGSTIGRVKPDGTITIFSDPRISYPLSITKGPDGALWFTNPGNDSIGRMATDGTVTSFKAPSVYSPIDITTGSDGALWFTSYSNNSIGRITTDGTITSYSDPSIYFPDGIASGPDGAIWFTNAGNNTIGRITV